MPSKKFVVDADMNGNGLLNVGEINDNDGNVIYDAVNNVINRDVLPEENAKTISSNDSTNGNTLIFVDTSSTTITVTLSSSDANSGEGILILDSASNAGGNTITVATESTETIDGSNTFDIQTDNGALSVHSDGTNWFTGIQPKDTSSGSAIVLDFGDDGTNESSDLQEIATENDRNSSFTEPSADKLLVEPYKIGAPEGYLQHDGLVISNNGTDGDHDIDTVGGAVGVHDFSGNWRVVELPDETPAFQIDGTSDTAGALINGSSLTADTWYELGIIADSSGSNSPSVVGYTDANRPTASGDLPSGYDLFRAMGTPGKTWWVRTDGSSNIYGFSYKSDGWIVWSSESINSLGSPLSTSSPNTDTSNSLDISGFVPPSDVNLIIGAAEIESAGTNARFSLHNDSIAGSLDGQSVLATTDSSGAVTGAEMSIRHVDSQTIYWWANTAVNYVELRNIPKFKAVN